MKAIYHSLLLLAAFPFSAFAETLPIAFHHIFSTDGLSNNSVRAMAQDGNGYVWLGTSEGLNRFDGINFTIYKNDPNDSGSISSNLILDLLLDSNGYLWIATDHGLNRWNPNTNRIDRFIFNEEAQENPGINFILALREDSQGRIWAGAVNGLRAYSYETESFQSFFHDPDDPASLSFSHINDIFEDHDGAIWIATHSKGMNRLNEDGETFTRIMPDEEDLTPSIPWTPTCIFQDSQSRYWVGTWDKGLLRFNADTFAFEPVEEIRNCNVRLIEEDHFGNLWIGTMGQGLYSLDSESGAFLAYQHDPTVESSLSSNRVYSFMLDSNELYWVGVAGGGVNTFRHPKTQIQRFQPSSIHESSLSDRTVASILADSNGIVWIGTQEKGLDRFDPKTGEYKNYIYATESNKPHVDTVVVNHVYSLRQLDDARLLVGTLGYGLLIFDPELEEFTFHNDEERLPYIGYFQSVKDIEEDPQGRFWVCNDNGHVICLDSSLQIIRVYGDEPARFGYPRLTALEFHDDGHLWVGTEAGGVDLLDIETGAISHHTQNPQDQNSLSNNAIWDILNDSQGRIWIGTNDGLNRYDRETGAFVEIEALNEFPSRSIQGIAQDEYGSLWLSSNRGLMRYDPNQDSAKWHGLHNGIQGYEFSPKSRDAGRDGMIYFGGQYGFNRIDTKSFEDYQTNAAVALNQIFVKGERYASDRQAWDVEHIELPYSQNSLALRFSLLDYAAPALNSLEYRLGETAEWQAMNPSQEILFADLSPGARVLQVRGANADGAASSKMKELAITVLPPYWMTWWFRSILGMIALGLACAFYRHRVRQIAFHNRELQEKVDQQIAQLKILDGLLPICAYCKKVRDDHGYWSQVEAYIQKRSHATFSHGICPDCVKEHFPEIGEGQDP